MHNPAEIRIYTESALHSLLTRILLYFSPIYTSFLVLSSLSTTFADLMESLISPLGAKILSIFCVFLMALGSAALICWLFGLVLYGGVICYHFDGGGITLEGIFRKGTFFSWDDVKAVYLDNNRLPARSRIIIHTVGRKQPIVVWRFHAGDNWSQLIGLIRVSVPGRVARREE